jgi:iron(III) transport system ATP-binding protein
MSDQPRSEVAVRISRLSKRFGGLLALDDVSLELRAGTVLALLGPSGCGKTTVLRLIAGFERPDAGSIEVDGRLVATSTSMVPPERRRVGLVFQDLALFPHLSARDNVAYGIRREPGHAARADELLELVGLASDGRRMPHELSGGMQQRVALARALAPRPDVLLLDEPFSSLDQAMRTQLRAEVRQILREARQSAIFVTHDQAEALTVADTVAVMTRGKVLQVAPPEIIYAAPATPYVATFVGVSNLVSAEVKGDLAQTRFGAVRLIEGELDQADGHALCLLRPEHFSIEEAPQGTAMSARWQVMDRRFSGSEILLELRATDGERLWVEAGSRVRHLGLGDFVQLRLRDVETVAFRRAGSGDVASSSRAHPAR